MATINQVLGKAGAGGNLRPAQSHSGGRHCRMDSLRPGRRSHRAHGQQPAADLF